MTPTHATPRRWRRRAAGAALVAATVLIAPLLPSGSLAAAGPRPDIDLPERAPSSHERLASSLRDDLAAAPAQPASPGQRRSTVPPVTVVVQSTDVAATRAEVERAGGTVTDTAGDLVQADVPPAQLGVLADATSTQRVREPYEARSQATSEGVAESGASAWIGAGKNGSGVKVAIVDVGFQGYQTKLNVELPASVETDFSRCTGDGDTNHGTAVAEIVHDEAPGAALYLVCVDTDVEFISALATLESHGVKVVNGSIGFTIGGRGDGSGGPGTVAGAVAALRRQGILYIAAAGNYGLTHWSFSAVGDAPGNDDIDLVNIDSDDVLAFLVAPGAEVTVSITWDEWPIAHTDFDAYVISETCPTEGSVEDQTSSALPPVEQVQFTSCTAGFDVFGLVIDRFSGTGTPRMDVSFDGPVAQIERVSPGGIAEPASSPAVMAVGAHCYLNGTIEGYSSVGPTIDGRVKPDITGPDSVSGSIEGPAAGTCEGGFGGTSAATPHVAGAAAVLLGTNPALDVAELQQLLEDRALDGGVAGKDNQFGSGRLRLGAVDTAPAPVPRKLTPLAPLRLFDSRPGPLGASEAAFGGSGRTTPLGGNSEVAIQVAGIAGVPADATAVVLNVTATGPTQAGWITVHPDGAVPNSSNLNFVAGQTSAAHVTATVGGDDKVRFYNSAGNTDLIVDISGYYGPTSSGNAGLTALAAPSRAFDSREGTPGFAEGPFGAGGRTTPLGGNSEVQVQLAGLGGIPANASAVVVNLTVTGPTAPGWLTLYPTGTARPLASTLNFVGSSTVANLAVVPVGTDGKVTIYNSAGSSHAIIDAIGYFTPGAGSGYVALDPPTRDLDSRTGNGPRLGALGSGSTYRLEAARYYGVPARATAVLLSVIAVQPTATGWFTVYPGTASAPLASNLNFTPGVAVPNAVISALGTDGTVAITNANGSTHAVADLAGYFVAT